MSAFNLSTFPAAQYGKELATLMKHMVLIGEVAHLAKEIEKEQQYYEGGSSVGFSASVASGLTGDAVRDFVVQEADAVLEAETTEAKNTVVVPNAADAATAFMKSRNKKEPPSPIPDGSNHEVDIDDGEVARKDEEFTSSEQEEISELLDAWEEPNKQEESEVSNELLFWLWLDLQV